jgi:hypothetical protein
VFAGNLAAVGHRVGGASADAPDTLSGFLAALGRHLESHAADEIMVLGTPQAPALVPKSRTSRGAHDPAAVPPTPGPAGGAAAVTPDGGSLGCGADRVGLREEAAGSGVFVLTQLREVGTLKPCAWGVPGLGCVSSTAWRVRKWLPQSVFLLPSSRGVQCSTHPTAWVGDCSRLVSPNGTQKPEK